MTHLVTTRVLDRTMPVPPLQDDGAVRLYGPVALYGLDHLVAAVRQGQRWRLSAYPMRVLDFSTRRQIQRWNDERLGVENRGPGLVLAFERR